MANLIEPKSPFKAIDAFTLLPTQNRKADFPVSLTNIAAVVAAEHLRSQGYRGLHMVGLIALASTATTRLGQPAKAAGDIAKLIAPERTAWPDDLQNDSTWKVAQALCLLFGAKNDGDGLPSLADLINEEAFIGVGRILVCYANAVDLMCDAYLNAENWLEKSISAFDSLPASPEHHPFVAAFLERVNGYCEIGGRMTLAGAWTFARQPFNVPKHEVVVGPAASSEEVKARRMRKGAHGSASLIKNVTEKSLALEALRVGVPDVGLRRAIREVGLESILRNDLSEIYCSTFMRKAAYDQFLKDGVYRDVWSRGPSWHSRYHDRPLVARSFSEMRAFGERGDGITYGYITSCNAWQDEVVESATRGYGEVEIYWKPERVLPFATATLEDSMRSKVMIDPAHSRSLAYLVIACLAGSDWAEKWRGLAALAKSMDRSTNALSGRFIEFQCHSPLTPDDVESTVIHESCKG
jgi:hypothetical protein